LIIDLRGAAAAPESRWLSDRLDFRSIGALAMEYAFYPTVVTDHFDALIFFDQTHPSVPLSSNTQSPLR
jgi:erythromycin esterase-like protein